MIHKKNAQGLKIMGVLLLLMILIIFFSLDGETLFSLQTLKQYNIDIQQYIEHAPVQSALLFVTIYMVFTGLSLPVAGFLSLCSGAFFGLAWGTILATLGGIIGASAAFLLSRFLLRDMIQGKYSKKLHAVNRGIEKDGAIYLLSLRLFPVIPYFILNLLMGVTPIRIITYILVSIAGMLPVTFIFVNAGTQLQNIQTMDDVMSPTVITAFMLLAVFILIGNWLATKIRRRYEEPSIK
jgi:uncharacterized membrane protein YdjX (TVP38/TMEM64 family)